MTGAMLPYLKPLSRRFLWRNGRVDRTPRRGPGARNSCRGAIGRTVPMDASPSPGKAATKSGRTEVDANSGKEAGLPSRPGKTPPNKVAPLRETILRIK